MVTAHMCGYFQTCRTAIANPLCFIWLITGLHTVCHWMWHYFIQHILLMCKWPIPGSTVDGYDLICWAMKCCWSCWGTCRADLLLVKVVAHSLLSRVAVNSWQHHLVLELSCSFFKLQYDATSGTDFAFLVVHWCHNCLMPALVTQSIDTGLVILQSNVLHLVLSMPVPHATVVCVCCNFVSTKITELLFQQQTRLSSVHWIASWCAYIAIYASMLLLQKWVTSSIHCICQGTPACNRAFTAANPQHHRNKAES